MYLISTVYTQLAEKYRTVQCWSSHFESPTG